MNAWVVTERLQGEAESYVWNRAFATAEEAVAEVRREVVEGLDAEPAAAELASLDLLDFTVPYGPEPTELGFANDERVYTLTRVALPEVARRTGSDPRYEVFVHSRSTGVEVARGTFATRAEAEAYLARRAGWVDEFFTTGVEEVAS